MEIWCTSGMYEVRWLSSVATISVLIDGLMLVVVKKKGQEGSKGSRGDGRTEAGVAKRYSKVW